MNKKMMLSLLTVTFAALLPGCDPGPLCGPGTYEKADSCIPALICDKGTHELNGKCVADPAATTPPSSPAKTLVCGIGTHEVNGVCVVNASAHFIKAEVTVSPKDTTMVVASYELSVGARVYLKFKYSLNDKWLIVHSDNDKVLAMGVTITNISPNTNVFWRMEAINDDGLIVDTREGETTTPQIGYLGAPCYTDSGCPDWLQCSSPEALNNPPSGFCAIPCHPSSNPSDCPSGQGCFQTWENPLDHSLDKWSCLNDQTMQP